MLEYGILWKHIPREKEARPVDSRGSTMRHAVRIHGGGKNSVENPSSRIHLKRETGRTPLKIEIKNQVDQRRRMQH